MIIKYFLVVVITGMLTAPLAIAKAPENVYREMVVEATAYSSTFDQTDDTPFIAANGTFVHDGVVAANFLPFGTKIKIPGVFGEKVFTVEDRMHRRFKQRIDVWFPDRESALKFGYKILKVQILEI